MIIHRPLVAAIAAVAGSAFAVPASATPPGSNGQILWERDLRAAPHLYAANADGSGARALFSTSGEFDGAWSPTSATVAFGRATAKDFSERIYLGDLASGAVRRLATGRLVSLAPTFSPDGRRIAFFGFPVPKHSAHVAHSRLYVIGVNGSGRRAITSRSVDSFDPDFSPDGTKVVYSESRVVGKHKDIGQFRLAVIGIDGKNRRTLTRYGGREELNAKWMPDGNRIVFETGSFRHPGPTRSDIEIMNADGTGATPVLATAAFETNPVPAPDGTRIVFTSDRDRRGPDRLGPGFEIYTASTDGTEIARLTNNRVPDIFPDWQRLP